MHFTMTYGVEKMEVYIKFRSESCQTVLKIVLEIEHQNENAPKIPGYESEHKLLFTVV